MLLLHSFNEALLLKLLQVNEGSKQFGKIATVLITVHQKSEAIRLP